MRAISLVGIQIFTMALICGAAALAAEPMPAPNVPPVKMSPAKMLDYSGGGRRDPFVPLVTKDGQILKAIDKSEFNIEGIIYDPDDVSLALINGEFYKEGDEVKGATIVEIAQDYVVINRDDEDITIWLNQEFQEEEERIL